MKQGSESIRQLLEIEFQPEYLHIEDESWKHASHPGAKESGGGHFNIHIKSSFFNNLSRMEQHRKVMKTLKPLFPSTIHAASIRTEDTD